MKLCIKLHNYSVPLYQLSIGIDRVIIESLKGTILQRNYRKMTIHGHGHFPIISL